MRLNLSRGYLLLPALIFLSSILYGQEATPGVEKSSGQNPASGPSAGMGHRLIGGPGAPGRPQPFEEAKKIGPPKNDKELAGAIKQLADELAASGKFSGSVLVAADGKPLIEEAWGDADREHKVSNKPETSYDVGSIGKLFTQIAILQLAEAGKVRLDDAFGKYLTNYPNADVAGKVTIRQLLLHSSGMGDFLDRITPDIKLGSMRELKDFVPLFVQKPLEFAPGTANRYSNAGYVVLGMIVEAVSGENYYGYIERHILQPAGMTHSGFFERSNLPRTDSSSPERSGAGRREQAHRLWNRRWRPGCQRAAGGRSDRALYASGALQWQPTDGDVDGGDDWRMDEADAEIAGRHGKAVAPEPNRGRSGRLLLRLQRRHVDDETVFHVAAYDPLPGSVDVLHRSHFDLGHDVALRAEIEHLLRFLDSTDARAGDGTALHEKIKDLR
jgi:CubicO group peptidase (beta-lactamase class C family)